MTNRWSRLRAAVAGVAVVTGCAGAVAGASGDDSEPAPETEAPVTTTPPPSADEVAAVDDAGRVGFIGLPPEGANPSTPEGGEIVVSIRACYTPTGWFSTFDPLFPALGELTVLADGRLIWLKYEDLPEGANSLSTGLLEQRLTPEGVELMRSEASAALGSGEPQHCGEGYHDVYAVYAGDWADAQSLRADDAHLARVVDPWSWLPATAWEDPEIRAYVPSMYLVTINERDNLRIEPEDLNAELTPQLPAVAADLTPADRFIEQISPFAPLTTEEARAFAAGLDDAGFVQDGLWNAYHLTYQFIYHDESQEAVVQLVFRAFDLEAILFSTPPETPPGT